MFLLHLKWGFHHTPHASWCKPFSRASLGNYIRETKPPNKTLQINLSLQEGIYTGFASMYRTDFQGHCTLPRLPWILDRSAEVKRTYCCWFRIPANHAVYMANICKFSQSFWCIINLKCLGGFFPSTSTSLGPTQQLNQLPAVQLGECDPMYLLGQISVRIN